MVYPFRVIQILALLSGSFLLAPSGMATPTTKAKPQVKIKARPKPAPKELSEWEQRIQYGTATEIIVADGTVISAPPQLLVIQAPNITYKTNTLGLEFGTTILKGDAKTPARVTLNAVEGKAPIQITGNQIEVETALTEILFTSGDVTPGDKPWADLAAALIAAPHSPRFSTGWDDEVLSSHTSNGLTYDRRSQNLHWIQDNVSMESVTHHQDTENNVSEAKIEKRAKNSQLG